MAAARRVAPGASASGRIALVPRPAMGFDLAGVNTAARGRVGWRHAFGETTPLSRQGFAVTIAGVPIARNSAVLEAGLDFKFTAAATLGVSCQGQVATDTHQHAIKANFNIRF